MEVTDAIRKFITTNFYVADASQLADDTSLLDSGVIDSTGVLEVIAFLEAQFGVQVADEDMLPDNLDSIAKIRAFVGRMKERGAAP
jgi:acyl carrier protein